MGSPSGWPGGATRLFMTFDAKLKEYMTMLKCSQKELAAISGLSPSVISRYRTGARAPGADTETLNTLIAGIVRLAEERGVAGVTQASVSQAFSEALADEDSGFPYERLRENLNTLLSALSVVAADLSHSLNYDTSYISRIRNGQRRPADPATFISEVSRYIVRRYPEPKDRAVLAHLLDCKAEEIAEDSICMDRLTGWLSSGEKKPNDAVFPFLANVDRFDLNEYIRSIHYDELEVSDSPFRFFRSRNYYGIEEMRKGYLDFFLAAALSESEEPLILMDDTPMTDKLEGTDLMRQCTSRVALALKRGLRIHMIHDVSRPFEEMMMGLEIWVPMYMTGQIAPYYLHGVHDSVFGHLLFSSGTAALSGECIRGYLDKGKLYLTSNRTEVEYYRTRARNLLSKASPLMNIYYRETEEQYRSFLQVDENTPGTRRSILSAPPLYTLSDGLLEKILARTGQSGPVREQILACVAWQRDRMERILARDRVTDELPLVTEAEFAEYPMALPLSAMFFEADILCTYEEYLEHLEQTKAYAQAHPNYTPKYSSTHAFRSIQIVILEGNWAVISRNKAPAIHFVVRHPRLLNAIENFIPPIVYRDPAEA